MFLDVIECFHALLGYTCSFAISVKGSCMTRLVYGAPFVILEDAQLDCLWFFREVFWFTSALNDVGKFVDIVRGLSCLWFFSVKGSRQDHSPRAFRVFTEALRSVPRGLGVPGLPMSEKSRRSSYQFGHRLSAFGHRARALGFVQEL